MISNTILACDPHSSQQSPDLAARVREPRDGPFALAERDTNLRDLLAEEAGPRPSPGHFLLHRTRTEHITISSSAEAVGRCAARVGAQWAKHGRPPRSACLTHQTLPLAPQQVGGRDERPGLSGRAPGRDGRECPQSHPGPTPSLVPVGVWELRGAKCLL